MAKSSVPRHSKSARKPVTIDLEPSAIGKTEAKAKETPAAEPVGFDPAIARQSAAAPEPAIESTPGPEETSTTGAAGTEQPFGRASAARPATESAPPAVTREAGDQFGRLASGVIGGLVALVGVAALQWAGLLPSQKADLSGVEQQIAALQRTPSQNLGEGAELALNGAVENAKKAVEQVSALAHEMSLIKQSVDEVKRTAGAAGSVDTSAVDERIAALEAKLNASQQQVDQASAATERLTALEAKVNDTSGQANMALAMAATGLKAALDRGSAFSAELDTYAAVAPSSDNIESLRAFAPKGIPTVGMLASEFGDIAAKIVATTRTVDPNASILDRLWSSAGGLVEARPVGMVAGESVDAITARVEANLGSANLGGAIAEWEKLPDNAKAVSADFAEAMKARQKADEALAKALSDALAGAKAPASSN